MRATFRNLYNELNVAAFVRDRHDHATSVVRWALILIPMAALVGTLCAAFLWSLDAVTRLRFAWPWLLYLLPLGGFVVGLLYHLTGRSVEGGNNLIVEQIHEPGGGVPLRMAPLIFFGTVVTHLFGGSAGREGTAVQLGGSLASGFGRALKLDADGTRVLLMGGIAAGFGAVFGTPIAGAVFALEVLAIGRVEYRALVPCLAAALVGDWTCLAWGIHHGTYRIEAVVQVDALLVAKAGLAGVAFGLVGLVFSEANHALGGWLRRLVPYGPLRPVTGGLAVIALVYLFGTRDYLGLGTLAATPDGITLFSFFGPDTHPWSWALKLLFTVVTLSAGFKGGEVTPLFFSSVLRWAMRWRRCSACRPACSQLSASSPCSRVRPTRRSPAPLWASSCSARSMRYRSRSPASSPISAQGITASICRSASSSARCLRTDSPRTSPCVRRGRIARRVVARVPDPHSCLV